MPVDSFEKRAGKRISYMNQRRPYLVDSEASLEGLITEIDLIALNLGLTLKRDYEDSSYARMKEDDVEPRKEPFMIDRWAFATDQVGVVREAVTFVIRGEDELAQVLRSWFDRQKLECEASFSAETPCRAYSFIVTPQVTVMDPLDVC